MEINQLQSAEIDKITTAFVEAKKGFKPVWADSKSNYKDFVSLDAIEDATRESLGSNGLAFKQNRVFIDGHIMLQTQLIHVSGQWLSAYMPLSIEGSRLTGDQAWGSSTSYQRRYEAYGFLGLGKGDAMDPDNLPEDLDKDKPKAAHSAPSDAISDKQMGLLRMLLKEQPNRESALLLHYKIDDLSKLSRKYMNEVVAVLKPKE